MNRLFLATASVFSIASILCGPAEADLGDADLGEANVIINDGKIYKAVCGKDEVDCNVKFKDGRFIVGDGDGITKEQVAGVTTEKIHTGDFLSSWHFYEYRIKYTSNEGNEKAASLRFYNDKVNEEFRRNFAYWLGGDLR